MRDEFSVGRGLDVPLNKPIAVPTVLFTNANHVLNKIDELQVLADTHAVDIICITESWLNGDSPDSLCSCGNFRIFRKDRTTGSGGGVMCYVSDLFQSFPVIPIPIASGADFETVWILVRPRILPRPWSCIVVAVVYIPPWYSNERCREFKSYILSCIDFFRTKYSHPGFIICGDFNTCNTNFFIKLLRFKQKVTKPTRGANILDRFFTNFDTYSDAMILPPLGRSDHNCMLVLPCVRYSPCVGTKQFFRRELSPNAIDNIAKELVKADLRKFYLCTDIQSQANIFYDLIFYLVDKYAPLVLCKLKDNDKPWVTMYFKELIHNRDVAFRKGDTVLFNRLRNKVNRLRKSLRKSFVEKKLLRQLTNTAGAGGVTLSLFVGYIAIDLISLREFITKALKLTAMNCLI